MKGPIGKTLISFWLITAALAILTAGALLPVLDNGFLNFDDRAYIVENPPVLDGLSLRGAAWAFTKFHAANWHPLTWLSHMGDVQVYGLNPRGHHLTSLLLHLAGVVALFAVLRSLTGATGRSAAVAALFAIHPLHVESVAWVAERKDVLSGLFWAATLAAYLSFVRSPGRGRYLLLLATFAAGLMSKPMLVTLPFVLLLLDFWPLQRIVLRGSPEPAWPAQHPLGLARALAEKLPLFGLAAVSCVITVVAQREAGALRMLEGLPFLTRLANALVSYVIYLGKMAWPTGLVVLHPYPFTGRESGWGMAGAAGASAAFLAAVTWIALRERQRRPYLAVGWLWYLVTLVPVIGLVQAGVQGWADRYTYLTLTGVFLAAAWGVRDATRRFRRRAVGAVVGVGTAVLVLAFAAAARKQIGTWKDGPIMFRRCLDLYPGEWAPHHLYADAVVREGRYAEAVEHALEAARLNFGEQRAETFGAALESRGRTGEALAFYAGLVRLRPENAAVRYLFANALLGAGRLEEATSQYRAVLQRAPGHGHAQNNLGVALERAGRSAEAADCFRAALRVEPRNAQAHNNLGLLLVREGLLVEGIRSLREAVLIRPDYVSALQGLASALLRAGRGEESALWARKAQRAEAAQERRRITMESFHGKAAAPPR